MKTGTRCALLLSAALTLPLSQAFFQGCATITNGPLQRVKFDSKPAGATLYVNGIKMGVTPRLVMFSRFQSPHVRFEMEGFEPFDLKMKNYAQWEPVEGNILLGVAPIVVDVVTGSLYQVAAPDKPGLTTNPTGYGHYQTLFVGVTLTPQLGARRIGQMKRK